MFWVGIAFYVLYGVIGVVAVRVWVGVGVLVSVGVGVLVSVGVGGIVAVLVGIGVLVGVGVAQVAIWARMPGPLQTVVGWPMTVTV